MITIADFTKRYPPGWFDSTDTIKVLEETFLPGRIVTVYVAGPYTSTESTITHMYTRAAIKAADELFNLGFMPLVPHLNRYWDSIYPHSYDQWMQWCYVWLERCDAVLRILGESNGADDEVAFAELCGIPVFYSVEELYESRGGQNVVS